MDSKDSKNDRRKFLQFTATAIGAVILGDISAGCASTPPKGPLAGGNLRDLSEGDLVPLKSEAVLLGRDSRGIYAMSALCTHFGCDLRKGTIEKGGAVCPCHGARFDANGTPIKGPAKKPLEHYRVDIGADGAITVLVGTVVPADQRAQAK